MIKTVLTATAAAFNFALPAQAVTVVQWDFETAVLPGAGTSWTGIAASTGTGTASGVHTAASTWSAPAGNGTPKSASANAWAMGDYWQFSFSTVGYTSLAVRFDETGSNTGPRDFTLQYSSDSGSSFTTFASYTLINGAWSAATPVATTTFTFDLSAVSSLNNNSGVVLRLVDASTMAITGGTVAGAGTSRVDNFTVNLTPVPEANTAAMLLAGLAALGYMAKRRNA